MTNTLYYGDNLDILRQHVLDELPCTQSSSLPSSSIEKNQPIP